MRLLLMRGSDRCASWYWRRIGGNLRDRLLRRRDGLNLYRRQHPKQLTKNLVAGHSLQCGFDRIRDGFLDGFHPQCEFVAISVLEDMIVLHVRLFVLSFGETFYRVELSGAHSRL